MSSAYKVLLKISEQTRLEQNRIEQSRIEVFVTIAIVCADQNLLFAIAVASSIVIAGGNAPIVQ